MTPLTRIEEWIKICERATPIIDTVGVFSAAYPIDFLRWTRQFHETFNPATQIKILNALKSACALHNALGDGNNGPPEYIGEEWYALSDALAEIEKELK